MEGDENEQRGFHLRESEKLVRDEDDLKKGVYKGRGRGVETAKGD